MKPKVKDGHHFRWFMWDNGFKNWEPVSVGPYDRKCCCFERPGFAELHMVKDTKSWQWGDKIPEYEPEAWKRTREMCS